MGCPGRLIRSWAEPGAGLMSQAPRGLSWQRREDMKPRATPCLGVTRPRQGWMHIQLMASCPTCQGCRTPASSEAGRPVPSCPATGQAL